MPRISVFNLGSIGINRDTPSHLLPPEAWSAGRNARMVDNKAVKFTGHDTVLGTPTVAPFWNMSVISPLDAFWLYANATKVYGTNGTTHTDLTRTVGGDYSTTEDLLWNGGILGGVAVITNGIDVPQRWATASLGTPLDNLPNWPATDRCRVIRPFKAYLVAFNITRSGSNLPHRVKWSHPADPGSIPSSWDETDPTVDAGEVDLSDAHAGLIRDAQTLRDTMVIYKDKSTWGMQHIGGNQIFRFFPIFTSGGIIETGCVTPFGHGANHFVADGDDIIVHNGQQANSIVDNTWKRFLVNNLDQSNYQRAYVVSNSPQNEVWYCFPEVGATWPTLALVWNYADNTLGVRELPGGIPHIAAGVVPPVGSAASWDSATDSWDTIDRPWDEQTFTPYRINLVAADVNKTQLQRYDTTQQFGNLPMTFFLERTGLAMVGTDRQGQPKVDFERRKLIKRMWPKITGGPVNIRVGMQEFLNDTVRWGPSQAFDPTRQSYLDFCETGRLAAIRFESNTDVSVEIHGYDLEMEFLGVL